MNLWAARGVISGRPVTCSWLTIEILPSRPAILILLAGLPKSQYPLTTIFFFFACLETILMEYLPQTNNFCVVHHLPSHQSQPLSCPTSSFSHLHIRLYPIAKHPGQAAMLSGEWRSGKEFFSVSSASLSLPAQRWMRCFSSIIHCTFSYLCTCWRTLLCLTTTTTTVSPEGICI